MLANQRSRSLAPGPTIHYSLTDPSEPARLPGAGIERLVDTRRHVVVRRGATAFTVDWDGTLRVR